MPTYCFKEPDGTIHDRIFSYNEIPETIELEDGIVCERCIPAEISSQGGQTSTCWPRKSYAAAVPAWKAKEMTEAAAAAGIPTDHDRFGKPTLTSAGHNRKYMEWRGLTDFDGGYNSPDCRGHQSEWKK